ncbi:hypothetical protein INR49_018337 [Caranx melampygus]|nr:hypothetical protein INR49_018337 [Caranx melampygus]
MEDRALLKHHPDLQVLVERSSDQVQLKCHSRFKAPPSFVWYKNELKMEEETFSIRERGSYQLL